MEEKEFEKKVYWHWLCTRPDIGIKTVDRLLHIFGTPEEIFRAKDKTIDLIEGISDKKKAAIKYRRDISFIHSEYNKLVQRNIHFITREDALYPSKLRTIQDPPYSLFYHGTLPRQDCLSIGIVGSRRCSVYGREMARYFAQYLAKAGVQVISGMALGIDGAAHYGAFAAGERTYAVLGSGINVCYPREHIELFERLKTEGGLISEHGLNVKPVHWHFPLRNRLISGLCDGILVVEGGVKSGALITADYALEQGKDVFAVPGQEESSLSAGCKELIEAGARRVSESEEILEEYNIFLKFNKKLNFSLANSEKLVYSSLCLIPKNIQDIADETNLDFRQVLAILYRLENKGCIRQVMRNQYIINQDII